MQSLDQPGGVSILAERRSGWQCQSFILGEHLVAPVAHGGWAAL